ncbi:MAG: protein kinase [Rhodothermales bacterium]
MSETIRTRVGSDYEILAELGEGGMATILKARHKPLGRTVALKILPPHLLVNDEAYARFEREARAGAQLEHDHIVTTYDFGVHDGRPYIAVAFIEGETLSDRIRAKGRLAPDEAVRVIAPIAEALDFAHRKGVTHRDVKSSNIMIRAEDERPILIDFGIAQASFTHKLTKRGHTLGTPEYMSPEQAAAQEIGHHSDLYSLGVVLYECLTGRVPFQSMHLEVLLANIKNQPPQAVRERVPEVLQWLSDVVDRCLAKTPEDRFDSGAALAAALRNGLASQQDTPPSGQHEQQPPPDKEKEDQDAKQHADADADAHKPDRKKQKRARGRDPKKRKKKPVRRKKTSPTSPPRKGRVVTLAVLVLLAVSYLAYWLYPSVVTPTPLQEALQNPAEVTTLALSSHRLRRLPEAVTRLSGLHILHLGDNNLKDVPASLAQLTDLRRLYLWENNLTNVPEPLLQLRALRTLNLADNDLQRLPESIDQWSRLEELFLDDNQLTSLPESITRLRNLNLLSLANNELTSLPEPMGHLTNLVWLNLEGNPVPQDEIERLRHLLPRAEILY